MLQDLTSSHDKLESSLDDLATPQFSRSNGGANQTRTLDPVAVMAAMGGDVGRGASTGEGPALCSMTVFIWRQMKSLRNKKAGRRSLFSPMEMIVAARNHLTMRSRRHNAPMRLCTQSSSKMMKNPVVPGVLISAAGWGVTVEWGADRDIPSRKSVLMEKRFCSGFERNRRADV